MSTINTLSKFFYNTTVTVLTNSVDFDEGGAELQATLNVGTYTLTEYAAEWQRALRAIGTQDYVVSVNRTTGKLSFSAPLAFTLRALSGSRVGSGAWTTAGATATDKTGTSITFENMAGSAYEPQFYIYDYISKAHSVNLEDATASSTPTGYAQVASFGDGSRVPMNIRLITDKTGLKNKGFIDNPNGVSDFMTFIKYLCKKGRVEFMPDKDTPNDFVSLFLESTPEDKDARKFALKNMAVDVYESGKLIFRERL